MTMVEYKDDIIVIDAGFQFQEEDTPGIDYILPNTKYLEDRKDKIRGVIITHGHLDHVFSVAPVCGDRGIPAFVHTEDAYRLADPWASTSAEFREGLQGMGLVPTVASDVRLLPASGPVELAGLSVHVDHTPGHTEGSVMFRTLGTGEEPARCWSGDTLFAGSVGRTDLPGGDQAALLRSLAGKVLTLHDETIVLPGHGPATTVGAERARNPYLRGLPAPGGPA